MKLRNLLYTTLLAFCVFVTCNFDGCSTPPQPGTAAGGFPVTTNTDLVDSSGIVIASSPTPGIAVSGVWLSDDSGAAGSIYSFQVTTDGNGNAFVNEGRVHANWSTSVLWNPPCGDLSFQSDYALNVDPLIGIPWLCVVEVTEAGPNASTNFVLSGGTPSTITSYGNFSTAYGDPQLRVYVGGGAPGLVSTVSASSVVSGANATFPFPKQSNGSALGEGFYSLVNTNIASTGNPVWADTSYLAVGGQTSVSSAFGIDAGDITTTYRVCIVINNRPFCSTSGPTYAVVPIVTQYYSGAVAYQGHTIAVGSEPVAVKLYSAYSTIKTQGSVTTTTISPAKAVVVNSGSNSVSILNLQSYTTSANIAVGSQPMAVALNSAGTYAYVPGYADGSLYEIDLATQSVSRILKIAPGLLSVAVDPNGADVWVGGNSAMYEVSLSTFSVVSSVSVSGTVTSLAASNAQNELVYTAVQNCCSASSSYAASELLLSNRSTPGTYAHASAQPYAAYTMNGTLPSAAVLPQATAVVSTRFSNGMAASSTPTGFVIYDVVSHKQIMTGNTPTPVRGIASDPQCKFAYFTLPDSNEYISVPLEFAP